MSARRTEDAARQTYQAAERWVNQSLRRNGSLFTPDAAIWTPELLEELHTRFLDQPDEGTGNFIEKLEQQLAGSPAAVYQLMGEVLYVSYLILANRNKQPHVETVLGWSPEPVEIPPELISGLQAAFINLGAGNGMIPFYVGRLIETVAQWKTLELSHRDRLLNDPWAFKGFLFDLSFHSRMLENNRKGQSERDVLLHIVFPDSFEHILEGDKRKIARAKAFARFVDQQETDIDRRIQQIRQAIEGKLGKDFGFYDENIDGNIRKYWKPRENESIVEVFEEGEQGHQQTVSDLQALADQTYLPVSFLREIESLLEEKRQVIFQGPPGTGKTYVAQKLALHLAGSAERVSLVQFHPSYAYEDFVQGFRPKQTDGGQVGFELRKGPLLRAAEQAQRESGAHHYLIIDEINRGNLAAVFGELYFLLEYRDAEISLQYSNEGEKFTLPKNLFIIGTMNTADRSIAMVDLALRRRFYFVEFHPEKEPVKGVLGRYLEKNPTNAGWVVDVVDKANELLKDSDAAIGPSYFMRKGLDEAGVKRIWKHSVLPYIAERLFDDQERLAEFDLEKLIKAVSSRSEDGDVSDTDEAGNGGE